MTDIGEGYIEIRGQYKRTMPWLLEMGAEPISVAGVMQRRSDILTKARKSQARHNLELLSGWVQHGGAIYTGDAVAFHPDGLVKVLLDAKPLREINKMSRVTAGGRYDHKGLVLPEGVYEKLEGEEFTLEDLGRYQTPGDHPIWRAVARDQKLLDEYIAAAEKEQERRPDKHKSSFMSVCLYREKKPTVYPIAIRDLFYFSSELSSGSVQNNNDSYHDRLIGVMKRTEIR